MVARWSAEKWTSDAGLSRVSGIRMLPKAQAVGGKRNENKPQRGKRGATTQTDSRRDYRQYPTRSTGRNLTRLRNASCRET